MQSFSTMKQRMGLAHVQRGPVSYCKEYLAYAEVRNERRKPATKGSSAGETTAPSRIRTDWQGAAK